MLPTKDIGNASVFANYDAAARIADRNTIDDPEWDYGVRRIAEGRYVIAVHDLSEDEFVFLGYL